MGIEAFGFDEILNKLQSQQSQEPQLDERVLRELSLCAEELCNNARDRYPSRDSGGYDDHTRNLRGSIGFKISFNGETVAKGGFDGRESEKGEDAANVALESFPQSNSLWEIVIVAGMEYARFVEAKGHNVITFLQQELTDAINEVKEMIKNNEL